MYNIDNKKIDDAVSKVIKVLENNRTIPLIDLFYKFNSKLYFGNLEKIVDGLKESFDNYKEWPSDLKLTTLVQITKSQHIVFIDIDIMNGDDFAANIYHALGHAIMHNKKPIVIYDVAEENIEQFVYVAEYERQDAEANIFSKKILMYLSSAVNCELLN